MSDEDRLDDAFRVMREDVHGVGSTLTRARILARVKEQRVRRRRLFVVLPLAAAFVGSIAWAALSGHFSSVLSGSRPGGVAGVHAPAALPSASVPPVASVVLPVVSAGPQVLVPAGDATSRSAPEPSPKHAAPSVSSAISTREQELYELAHHAQFVAHSPSDAVRAWDAYLAEFPRGRFAPEARYNRGISLIRLHRFAEAKAALKPFADGAEGGYRRKEASDLLDAIADTDGGK